MVNMFSSSLFLAYIIVSCQITTSIGTCYTGWIHFGESCYMFSNTKEKWLLAEASCIAHDAKLAEIYDKSQSDFLRATAMELSHEYFIGGRDDVVEGLWQWASNGQYFNFTNWAPDKPNNNDGGHEEDCITIDDDHHFLWNDEPCHSEHNYICERRCEH